jgi:hypothetical protein
MTTQDHCIPGPVRAALRIFPAGFRARYGRDLLQCIRDGRRDLGSDTFAVTVRFWVVILVDLARSALVERCRSIPRESWSLALRRLAGAVLIGAAVANVTYDAVSVKLSMGYFVALLTALSAITGVLLIRSRAGSPGV